MAPNVRDPWTREEVDALLRMRCEGVDNVSIAAALERSRRQVSRKVQQLREKGVEIPRLPPGGNPGPRPAFHCKKDGAMEQRRPRTCLACGNAFLSVHKGNRLCKVCRPQVQETVFTKMAVSR